MTNELRSCSRAGSRWALPEREDAREDNETLQEHKFLAASTSGRCTVVSGFERLLIILSTVLFIMTVTAQLCIYFKQL
ncbi:MAG: hypothetical protein ABRQ26_15935 [Syntrophomonadaceae bacterium]